MYGLQQKRCSEEAQERMGDEVRSLQIEASQIETDTRGRQIRERSGHELISYGICRRTNAKGAVVSARRSSVRCEEARWLVRELAVEYLLYSYWAWLRLRPIYLGLPAWLPSHPGKPAWMKLGMDGGWDAAKRPGTTKHGRRRQSRAVPREG